jgi:hypothetical protein
VFARLGGTLADSAPVSCDPQRAKIIAEKVVNAQISSDARYVQASERYLRGLLYVDENDAAADFSGGSRF